MTRVRRGGNAERGASAVEYSLLVVAIALIMVIGAIVLGKALKSSFSESSDCVNGVTSTAVDCG